MGVGHSHTQEPGKGTPEQQKTRFNAGLILTFLLVPFFLASTILLFMLWPQHINNDVTLADPYSAPPGGALSTGIVVSTGYENCLGNPAGAKDCFVAYTKPDNGGAEVPVPVNEVMVKNHGVQPGDHIRYVSLNTNQANASPTIANYGFIDFVRGFPMWILALTYAVAIIAVAGWKGFRAVIGLLVSYAIIVGFILPNLINGLPALPVVLVGAVVILFGVMYFAHGFSARTSTALLGTLFGLFTTAGLALLSMDAANLTGLADETNHTLMNAVPGISLQGVILCGMIIASLGVLNDVTITQSSAVWELHELAPDTPARKLFTSAMKIGRDHIASTVYTVSFAYVSTALPVLMLALLYDRALFDSLSSADLAEEVVRTLIGSIGLVLAIPMTTAVAVFVVKASEKGKNLTRNASLKENPEVTDS